MELLDRLWRPSLLWLSSTPASAATKTFRETTAEAVIKRAAAHHHEHHGGPESIIPEIEAIRRGMVESRPALCGDQGLGHRVGCATTRGPGQRCRLARPSGKRDG